MRSFASTSTTAPSWRRWKSSKSVRYGEQPKSAGTVVEVRSCARSFFQWASSFGTIVSAWGRMFFLFFLRSRHGPHHFQSPRFGTQPLQSCQQLLVAQLHVTLFAPAPRQKVRLDLVPMRTDHPLRTANANGPVHEPHP